MNSALLVRDIASAFSERTCNSLLAGMGIALFAWIVLQLMGRRSSSTRFAVWMSALLGIAVLPLWGGMHWSDGGIALPASTVTLSTDLALGLFWVWASIASLLLLRIGLSLWRIRKLRHSGRVLASGELAALPVQTVQEIQAWGAGIEVSAEVSVPTAIGFFRPLVLLPEWAVRELSGNELNSILLHELAHLQRRDDWTNLLQKVLGALFFFHPAMWWIQRQVALEREMACDDVVLTHTSNPRAYAECLISVAEKSFVRRGLAMVQAAVGRMHQTSRRVTQILDARRSPVTRVWKPALGMVAAFSAASVLYLEQAPQLVTFRDPVASADVAPIGAKPMLASYTLPSNDSAVHIQATPVHSTAKRAKVHSASASVKLAKLAKPSVNTNQMQTPAATLVVYQQFDRGNLMWTVYVWRVTVMAAPQPPVPASKI